MGDVPQKDTPVFLRSCALGPIVTQISLGGQGVMRTITILMALLLSACAPSAESIQQAIAQTQAAAVTPTHTPNPTHTPKPENTRGPTRTPRPTSTPEDGGLRNPVRLGQRFYLIQDNGLEYSVVISNVVRGDDAWVIVRDSNSTNEPPNDEMEYLVATINYKHTSSDDEVLEAFAQHWSILTNNRIIGWADDSTPCCFYDELRLISDGIGDITVAFRVYTNDENPLLVFWNEFYFDTNK